MNDMTNEQWEAIYKPITNPITEDGLSFETYGDELDYVRSHDEHNIWTEMDGDNGVYIVNGYHLVNRIQYYITDVAWRDGDDITITVCEYETCECWDEENAEGNPNCDICYGDGNITVWKD